MVASAPPKSLSVLQGPYGFNPVKFWGTFRPLTILLFTMALFSNWKYSPARRRLLIIAFAIDLAVTAATFFYFAPETGVIAEVPFDMNEVNNDLYQRAQLWKDLNLMRLAAFYLAGILLLVSLTCKPLMAVKIE